MALSCGIWYNKGNEKRTDGRGSTRPYGNRQSEDNTMPVPNDTLIPEGFKKCIDCGEIKSLSEFNSQDKKDGKYYYPYCKPCRRIRNKTYEYESEEFPDKPRRCSRCGSEYPATFEFFHRTKRHRSGMSGVCKKCRNIESLEWNHNHLERVLAASRTSYYLNQDKNIAYARQYRADHPDSITEQNRKWRLENPDERAATQSRRRARKRSLPAVFTDADRRRALDYFDHCCAACGRPRGLWHKIAMDHWIPLSDPRPDNPGTVPWNMVPLCQGVDGCNQQKHKRDPHEWLIERFGKRKAKQIEARIVAYFEWVKRHADK